MKKRSGLGRGLDALLPSEETIGAPEGRADQQQVSLERIDRNPRQPRESFDESDLDELAFSIKSLGILQPLLVRPLDGDRYELIAGERRLRAAKRAGLTQVPVMVVQTDERGSLERALVENIHRANLNPIEEAAAYKQLIDDGGLTQEALGTRLGRNRVTITNSLRLLDLPTSVQRMLIEKRLTAAHGKALLSLQRNPFQERLARRAADEKLSVRETEDLVKRYEAMTENTSEKTKPRAKPLEVTGAQQRLANHLQTRVRIEVGKRKGKIVLDFVSLAELDRLLRIITGEEKGSSVTTVSPD
ncbi:MAG: ParB family transcriptional regulator, chromosome partitioning protein [Actinomycetota bacterium]|nr:ParB family transcriptional regulator, chromosome partitioning protein [Actinomycetota bacterium]